MRSSFWLLWWMLLLPGVACIRHNKPDSPSAKQPDVPKKESDGSVTDPRVTAAVQSIAEVEASIDKHRGKVVIVDLWALW